MELIFEKGMLKATILYSPRMSMPRNPLQSRLDRILKAVALEKPDRTPLVMEFSGFAAHVTDTSMADFVRSPARVTEVMIRAFHIVGGGDAINYGTFCPYNLSYGFGAKVKVPGVDLPEGEMWQVFETEIMSREDYDRILEKGLFHRPSA